MGKFDVFLKYLGKEDSHSPEEIRSKLELDKKTEEIESTNVEENLAKVDQLLQTISQPEAVQKSSSLPPTQQTEEIDPEILKELERLDEPPPDISKLKEGLEIKSYEAETPEEIEGEMVEIETGKERKEEEISVALPPEAVTEEKVAPEVKPETEEVVEEKVLPEMKTEEELDLSGMFAEITPPEATEETQLAITPEITQPLETEISEEFKLAEEVPEMERFKEEEKGLELEGIPTPAKEEIPSFEKMVFPEAETMAREEKPQEERTFTPAPEFKEERIEIDQEKALKIRNKINSFKDSKLRKRVREALIKSLLSKDVENELVKMLLLNESEIAIKNFINKYLPEEEVKPEKEIFEEKPKKRKVIYSEEIRKQKEVEKVLANFSRFSFIGFILVVLLGFVFWRYIWIPSVVEKIYKEGLSALNVKDTTTAEAKFERAKQLGGPNIKWYNIYGLKYMELKNFEAARRKFLEALEYDPLNKLTIYNFANYYKNLYPPRFEDALNLLSRLYKKEPGNFEYLDKFAQTYVEWGDWIKDSTEKLMKYAEADRLYENFLLKKPKYTGAYFRLLDIAIKLKKQERIDVLFDTIDKINKRAVNEKTFTDLARYYLDTQRYDRAKKVFEKLIPYLTPLSKTNYNMALLQSETYYEYGRFLTINLDFQKAIKVLSNSIMLNISNAKSYNLLGEIYLMDEKKITSKFAAKEMFDNAIKYDPLYYKPYANMGHLYFYNSFNFADPEKAFSQAFYYYKIASSLLKDQGKDYLLSYNLGWLYYKYGDYESALQEFLKLYVDEPLNPILSYNMGNIFYTLKKYDLARTQYEKSIEYLENIASKISYINPEIVRHKELYTELARNYNNIGVIYLNLSRNNPKQRAELEQLALLNFYKSKDNALKVNLLYEYAEYNIKIILNKGVKNRQPAFDKELVIKTSLKKFIDEFRENLIKNL